MSKIKRNYVYIIKNKSFIWNNIITKIIKNLNTEKKYELECKPKIELLSIEVEKWKVKYESINSQIVIKDNMINNLQETIKRKNEENMKQNKIIKNYESTYH